MDELLARQTPHSLEAEQSVLGAMLLDSRCVGDVIGMLLPEDFYLQQNRDIYETIYSMFNFSEVIDPITVLDKMRERGVFNEQSSVDYVMQLMEITPTAANVKEYAAIVRDKALLRAIAETASEINETVYEGVGTAEQILESAEKKVFALRKGQGRQELEHIGTVLLSVFDRLKELSRSGSEIAGLSTGLVDLDRKINGLNGSDLILIAARPGMGKTSMALNITLNVAKRTDKAVAFFSLEMSKEQLVMRLVSNESFVDNQKLVTGNLTEDEWSKIGIASSAHDRRGDERQVPPHRQPRPHRHRLPPAHDDGRQGPSGGKPRARRRRDVARHEDHGQGIERPRHLPEPALPRQREPLGQAPHPVRPA